MFPAKTPDEEKLITFDYSTEAAPATTLSSPTLTVTALAGTNAAPEDLTLGSLNVVDQTVQVLVSGGLDGAKYRLKMVVSASNGEIHRIDKDLPVKEKAAVVA